jgi:hypothetical protein
MTVVQVDVKKENANDPVAGRFIIEHRAAEGAAWVASRPVPIHSKKQERKEFFLAPNTRLIVEGEDVTVPVYVKEQNAAMSLASAAGYAGVELPVLDSIAPATAAIGSADTSVTATGSGFTDTSTIVFNGAALPTTFGSATSLSATISPAGAVEGAVPVLVQTGPFPSESVEFTFTAATGGATSTSTSTSAHAPASSAALSASAPMPKKKDEDDHPKHAPTKK